MMYYTFNNYGQITSKSNIFHGELYISDERSVDIDDFYIFNNTLTEKDNIDFVSIDKYHLKQSEECIISAPLNTDLIISSNGYIKILRFEEIYLIFSSDIEGVYDFVFKNTKYKTLIKRITVNES